MCPYEIILLFHGSFYSQNIWGPAKTKNLEAKSNGDKASCENPRLLNLGKEAKAVKEDGIRVITLRLLTA